MKFVYFLHSMHALEIIVIHELKLDNSISDNEIRIASYTACQKDRNRFGGGVVMYIRDNILYS